MLFSCGTFVLELFLTSWLGTKVLDANDRLQMALYDLPWYDFAAYERRLLLLMVQFTSTQRVGFSAHNYIFCSVETFGMVRMEKELCRSVLDFGFFRVSQLMAKVYSALAFLQNFV